MTMRAVPRPTPRRGRSAAQAVRLDGKPAHTLEIAQRNLSLTATLFIAFAAEAFVNNFLDVHDLKSRVSATKFKNLDRGSTVQKYVDGVAIAYEPLFSRTTR